MAGFLSTLFVIFLAITLKDYVEARSLSPLYGSNAGSGFNDGNLSYKAMTAIRLYSGWVIDGIQGQYLDSSTNSLIWMPFHGVQTQFTEIHVAYPYERFVAASGKYGPYQQGAVTVTELSFLTYSNITGKTLTYGPYGGHEMSNQTSFQISDGSELVGLYGYTGDYMRGLGFVLESLNH